VSEPFNLLHRNQMMENEPPHTRLRNLVATALARGHVERLRPAVAAEAARLVRAAGPEFDLLTAVAEALAVTVIAELLGVPVPDRHRLGPWSAAIVRMYEVSRTPEAEAGRPDRVPRVRRLPARPGRPPRGRPARGSDQPSGRRPGRHRPALRRRAGRLGRSCC
jgi:cytochrome P450